MKTNNWLLSLCATRITDNRLAWRAQYEEHMANKDASTMSDYLAEQTPPEKINWGMFAMGVLDATTLTTLLVGVVWAIEIWITAKYII